MTLAARASEAPARPGVYFFLGETGELLYVGKAANLHRRLLDHARSTKDSARRGPASGASDVRWVECADEREALCREADLIVALAPPLNAAMAGDGYTFVCIDREPSSGIAARIRFRLTEDAPSTGARVYGGFARLGKGKISSLKVRSNTGYSALLRLLWVASSEPGLRSRIPARLRGSSPPVDHVTPIDPLLMPMLHDFLTGRSDRILTALRQESVSRDVPAFMRRSLDQDADAAQDFYRLGPQSLRKLRLRHGIRSGPVDLQTFSALLTDELRNDIGSFEVAPRSGDVDLVGRRLGVTLRRREHRRDRKDAPA